jgi:hypothetical protein
LTLISSSRKIRSALKRSKKPLCLSGLSKNVIYAQYNGYSQQGRKSGTAQLPYNYLINEHNNNNNFTYFNLGISTEQGGRYLNIGLANQQRIGGGRTVTYDSYEIGLTQKDYAGKKKPVSTAPIAAHK